MPVGFMSVLPCSLMSLAQGVAQNRQYQWDPVNKNPAATFARTNERAYYCTRGISVPCDVVYLLCVATQIYTLFVFSPYANINTCKILYQPLKIKMKKRYFMAIGMIMSYSLQSQNYIPLLIDSLYTWSWSVDIHGDTLVSESWEGFSYDSNDSLVQRRNPTSRFNYSYEADTVYLLSETLDPDNNWNVSSRNTTVYNNGKIITKLTERFNIGVFENSALLHTYFYETSNLDIL